MSDHPTRAAPNRTAIVTGASRGIGAAITERLARDGFAVVVNYSGNADAAMALVAKIEAAGGRAVAVRADVADPAAVSAARRLRDGGRIISFSSSVVGLYQPSYAVYAATKAGVEAMTHIVAKELGPRGVTVNVLAPGPVATELFLTGKSDELVAQIAKMNPFGRLGEPDDIARVVSFLASPDGGWVSGQVIRANGGVV